METTRLHITGIHALKLMRAARSGEFVMAYPCDCTAVRSPKSAVSLQNLGLEGLLSWLGVDASTPMEVLVPCARERSLLKGANASVLSKELPEGAFLRLGNGTSRGKGLALPPDVEVFIDAPPLALVRAAVDLRRRVVASSIGELEAKLRLIALASEFCGSYARDPQKPLIEKCHYDKPHQDMRLVTLDKMAECLSQMPPIDGLSSARLATRYAIDGSGSPMETYINLGLTLPPRLAGLSMAKPLANKQLVRREGTPAITLRHESLRPDFQWPDFGTLAEYLGNKDHASHEARTEDKNRLQDFMVAGYKAFYLMFDDVRNAAALNRTALMLAQEFAKAGKPYEPYRIRKLVKRQEFQEKQSILVKTLLPPVLHYG